MARLTIGISSQLETVRYHLILIRTANATIKFITSFPYTFTFPYFSRLLPVSAILHFVSLELHSSFPTRSVLLLQAAGRPPSVSIFYTFLDSLRPTFPFVSIMYHTRISVFATLAILFVSQVAASPVPLVSLIPVSMNMTEHHPTIFQHSLDLAARNPEPLHPILAYLKRDINTVPEGLATTSPDGVVKLYERDVNTTH